MADTLTSSVALDNLFAGDFPVEEDVVTMSISQTGLRGWVMGKVTVAAGTAAADAGNTGDGAVSAFALAAGGPASVGDYIATCVIAATNAGTFNVVDPNGVLVGQAVVAGGAFTGGGITFAIADGATDFVVGDFVTFPVAAGSGEAVLLDIAATDGSQKFFGVLKAATTTTGAATKTAPVARTGEFTVSQLVFGGSTVAADVKEDMESKNAYQITLAAKVGA